MRSEINLAVIALASPSNVTCAYEPNFSSATFYEKDVDRVLEELKKAARQ